MTDAIQPGSEMSVTVRGYEVIVRISEDGTLQVTGRGADQLDDASAAESNAQLR